MLKHFEILMAFEKCIKVLHTYQVPKFKKGKFADCTVILSYLNSFFNSQLLDMLTLSLETMWHMLLILSIFPENIFFLENTEIRYTQLSQYRQKYMFPFFSTRCLNYFYFYQLSFKVLETLLQIKDHVKTSKSERLLDNGRTEK